MNPTYFCVLLLHLTVASFVSVTIYGYMSTTNIYPDPKLGVLCMFFFVSIWSKWAFRKTGLESYCLSGINRTLAPKSNGLAVGVHINPWRACAVTIMLLAHYINSLLTLGLFAKLAKIKGPLILWMKTAWVHQAFARAGSSSNCT